MAPIICGNRHHVKHSCQSDESDRVAGDIPHIPPSAPTALLSDYRLSAICCVSLRCNYEGLRVSTPGAGEEGSTTYGSRAPGGEIASSEEAAISYVTESVAIGNQDRHLPAGRAFTVATESSRAHAAGAVALLCSLSCRYAPEGPDSAPSALNSPQTLLSLRLQPSVGPRSNSFPVSDLFSSSILRFLSNTAGSKFGAFGPLSWRRSPSSRSTIKCKT
eukprot:6182079-Pleurochrysis_carterae.AAC.1